MRWVLLLTGAMAIWIGTDLAYPTRADRRVFDPHDIAALETRMWRSYYEHHSIRLFQDLAKLTHREYGMPFWRARAAAYHAARAAVVFQRGHSRADYKKALPNLISFYKLVDRSGSEHFDVNRAAALEVEWWIIHRERQTHDNADLPHSLAELQAAIYGQPADDFTPHAAARAEAMLLRDEMAAGSRAMSDQDWQKIGTLLDRSWTDLRAAVDASRTAIRSEVR